MNFTKIFQKNISYPSFSSNQNSYHIFIIQVPRRTFIHSIIALQWIFCLLSKLQVLFDYCRRAFLKIMKNNKPKLTMMKANKNGKDKHKKAMLFKSFALFLFQVVDSSFLLKRLKVQRS
jgi:hypothetical protein